MREKRPASEALLDQIKLATPALPSVSPAGDSATGAAGPSAGVKPPASLRQKYSGEPTKGRL